MTDRLVFSSYPDARANARPGQYLMFRQWVSACGPCIEDWIAVSPDERFALLGVCEQDAPPWRTWEKL